MLSSYLIAAALMGMGLSSYMYNLSCSSEYGHGINYAEIAYARSRNRRGKIIRRMRG